MIQLAGFEDAREIFVCDADGRISFVVLQQYIVSGLIALDEIILEQQGIFLGLDYNVFDVAYLLYQ